MSTIRVDRITPYQSGSVAIEGLNITNLTIDGTLTASIQEGFVLVGGAGNVSKLAATSSFGGGGSTDITALNSFTASQENLNGTFATTGSNSFVGNQVITGSVNIVDGRFSVTSGSGDLTSSLAFTHNTISPTQGYSLFTLRHLNNDFNENFALKLFADDYIAKMQYEKDGSTIDILQTNLAGDLLLMRDTRLFNTDLTVDGTMELTGSLSSSGSANFLGDVTASSFTGSFTGSVAIAPSKAIIFTDEHIAISSYGLVPNTSGSYVIKIGQGAGNVNQVSFNTFIGHYAGHSNTTGQNNIYIGNNAGYSSVTGIENTFVGTNAATYAVSGSQNAILGFGVGNYSNGNNNTFIGTRAVSAVATGSENVVVGAYAATGSSNDEYLRFLSASVIIGYGASPMDDNETNQVIIGHKAIGNGSNSVTIGNNSNTNTYLKGTVSGSIFTGSFVGDGSGLTNLTLPNTLLSSSVTNFTNYSASIATRIDNIVAGTGFATTGSNTFNGTQTISGSLNVIGTNTFVGNQIVTGSLDVTGSVTADVFQLGAPATNQENTAYWLYGSFNNAGGISFGFSSGNAIADIDNVYINETSSDINGAAIVNSISWINGLEIGSVITIQGIDSSPSNLTHTIVLSVNSITDFSGAWGIGVSVLSSTPVAAAVNGSLYSLTYTTTTSGELYTITEDSSRLLVSSSNTEFNGFVVLSQVSSSYNYSDDTAAQAGGVPLGGLYHTSGSIKIRLV